MIRCLRSALLLVFAGACFGQDTKQMIRDVQRDVGLLQEEVRKLQSLLDTKIGEVRVLSQQAFDAANRADKAVTGMDSAMRERDKTLLAPVAAAGSKVDQMTNEIGFLREAMADLASRMGKLQVQMVDVTNAVKTLQSPPAPPPGPGSSTPPPGVSASSLYENGMRDRSSGNTDLALQQFQDYVRYFGNTDLAPNAQFYIGEILYNKGDFAGALSAFDLVLEKYPENNKTEDALYMKGMALLKAGERNAAAQEFRELLRGGARADIEQKARAQLKSLGLSAPAPSAKKKKS
jgi:TolA-binding protein